MANTRRRTRTKRARRVEIVYGMIQDEPDAGQFVLMTRDALDTLCAARQCITWGEYAELCETSWEEMLESWGSEISELTGEAEPSPDTPCHFDAMWGLYYVGDLISNPRMDAYHVLMDLFRQLPEATCSDERIRSIFTIDHGSPGGHLACVEAKSEEGLQYFERVLHETGYPNYVFTRDDTIMDTLYGRTNEESREG